VSALPLRASSRASVIAASIWECVIRPSQDKRRVGVEERRCELREDERAGLREELAQAQVGSVRPYLEIHVIRKLDRRHHCQELLRNLPVFCSLSCSPKALVVVFSGGTRLGTDFLTGYERQLCSSSS
jgi:hypothetical protein